MPPALMINRTLVHVMAWYCQATSHYLRQFWPRSVSPQCIKSCSAEFILDIFSFSIISQYWDSKGTWNPFLLKSREDMTDKFCTDWMSGPQLLAWKRYNLERFGDSTTLTQGHQHARQEKKRKYIPSSGGTRPKTIIPPVTWGDFNI